MSKKEQDTENRLLKLERSFQGIEKEITTLLSVAHVFENTKTSYEDSIWACTKCGARLGIYDPKTDELRVRHRDFFAWWKPGKGGYLKIVCRSCSFLNEVKYTEQ